MTLSPGAVQAVDMLTHYFDKTTSMAATNVAIGAFTFDPATNSFWTAGFTNANQQIRNIAWNGSAWVPTGTGVGAGSNGYVSETSWFLYKRSDASQTTASAAANTGWSGSQPTPGGMALNPQPITIGGNTYPAGTLMLINDGGGVVTQVPGSALRPEFTKRLYWYNLTETNTAPSGLPAPGKGTDYNGNNVVNWNDQFMTILTHSNLLAADGDSPGTTTSNLSRSFAFSSNGQSAYLLDSATTLGGIYKVNLTTSGSVTKVLDADTSGSTINTEPAVVHTSVRNFGFSGPGDQVLVEGSVGLGSAGGLNAYFDNGTFNTTPVPVFTAAQFQAFADLGSSALPSIGSVVADAQGNLYFFETDQWDAIYRYDTQGRFVKLASAAERAAHRIHQATLSTADGYNASVLDLQVRTSTTPGFSVTEVLYSDAAYDAPTGIFAFQVGDFNRNNAIDAADKTAFLAALKPRGVSTTDAGAPSAALGNVYRFDLNGTATGATAAHSAIIDWKDVKVLQQFLQFPNGDTNLDGSLDLVDLNMMRDNYYTLGGPADKTWGKGDFASLNSASLVYDAGAIDANIVNYVDLELFADTWLDVLGLPNITFATLDSNGYTGQFRADVIAAFNLLQAAIPIPEPSTLLLVGLGGGAMQIARRRKRRDVAK